jgi:hypothetical protein
LPPQQELSKKGQLLIRRSKMQSRLIIANCKPWWILQGEATANRACFQLIEANYSYGSLWALNPGQVQCQQLRKDEIEQQFQIGLEVQLKKFPLRIQLCDENWMKRQTFHTRCTIWLQINTDGAGVTEKGATWSEKGPDCSNKR